MKDLHEVVLESLDLHSSYELPTLDFPGSTNRLVVASGNALPTGRIVFDDERAVFADESRYQNIVHKHSKIESATVISASGHKHAPTIIRYLLDSGIETSLLTCNRHSPAGRLLPPSHVFETRSYSEPITYNTSSYLGMILSKTRENPKKIKEFLLSELLPAIQSFGKLTSYAAFYIIIPPEFDCEREMFLTKFDELFGGRLNGRCYTTEQTLHAKTLVPWERELFINIGCNNAFFGDQRMNLPLPENASFATMLSLGYYMIGQIQSQFPPWFKDNADNYKIVQRKMFEDRERRMSK